MISNAVIDGDIASRGSEAKRDLLLKSPKWFHRLTRNHPIRRDLYCDWHIIWRPRRDGIFWRFPNTVTATKLEGSLSGFAHLFGIFLKDVLASHEGEADDTWSNVAGDN